MRQEEFEKEVLGHLTALNNTLGTLTDYFGELVEKVKEEIERAEKERESIAKQRELSDTDILKSNINRAFNEAIYRISERMASDPENWKEHLLKIVELTKAKEETMAYLEKGVGNLYDILTEQEDKEEIE